MFLGLFLLLHIFFSNVMRLICINAGTDPGVMIWLPVLQMFPMLRAAQMSPWSILLFLIPIVNIFAQISWSLKIAKACGKGTATGIMLFLPITNFFALLYLAYSKNTANNPPAMPQRMVLDGLVGA
jgi:hypothetical protein